MKLFKTTKTIIQKTEKKAGNSIFGNMPAKQSFCMVLEQKFLKKDLYYYYYCNYYFYLLILLLLPLRLYYHYHYYYYHYDPITLKMRITFLTYYVPQSHPSRKLRDSENLRSFRKSKNLEEVLNINTLSVLFSTGKNHLEMFWCPGNFNKILDTISEGVLYLVKRQVLDLQLAKKINLFSHSSFSTTTTF